MTSIQLWLSIDSLRWFLSVSGQKKNFRISSKPGMFCFVLFLAISRSFILHAQWVVMGLLRLHVIACRYLETIFHRLQLICCVTCNLRSSWIVIWTEKNHHPCRKASNFNFSSLCTQYRPSEFDTLSLAKVSCLCKRSQLTLWRRRQMFIADKLKNIVNFLSSYDETRDNYLIIFLEF